MKKRVLLILFVFFAYFLSLCSACINSADDFAVEVEINKNNAYLDIEKLANAKNVVFKDNSYIFQSDYDPDLAVIIKQKNVSCNNCFSIRVQTPTSSETILSPYFSFVSSPTFRNINFANKTSNYEGWNVIFSTNAKQIEFRKGNYYVSVSTFLNRRDVFIEIYENLRDCSQCSGKCLADVYGNKVCFEERFISEIVGVLSNFGIIDRIEDLFFNSRIIGKGQKTITILQSQNSQANLKEAIKKELLFLNNSKILILDSEDIDSIYFLAEDGMAGDNNKIVYDSSDKKWKYYYQTENAVTNIQVDCKEFGKENIPSMKPVFSWRNSPYYVIPLVIVISFLIIIILLTIIGRIIKNTK